jgi:hypothetical protein
MLGLLPCGRVATMEPFYRVEYVRREDGGYRIGDTVFAGFSEIEYSSITPTTFTHWMPMPDAPTVVTKSVLCRIVEFARRRLNSLSAKRACA